VPNACDKLKSITRGPVIGCAWIYPPGRGGGRERGSNCVTGSAACNPEPRRLPSYGTGDGSERRWRHASRISTMRLPSWKTGWGDPYQTADSTLHRHHARQPHPRRGHGPQRRQRALYVPARRRRQRLAARAAGRQLPEQRLRRQRQLGADAVLPEQPPGRAGHAQGRRRVLGAVPRLAGRLPPGAHGLLHGARARRPVGQLVEGRRRRVVQDLPRAAGLRAAADVGEQQYVTLRLDRATAG
jgi:hypothetical protein